jgi:hypothetical protein
VRGAEERLESLEITDTNPLDTVLRDFNHDGVDRRLEPAPR